jgi:3-oxoadipate enol-lactonase
VPIEHPLHVEDVGDGEPVVVCAHGFGGSARNFRGQVRALKDRYRVITYDARGHARSRTAPAAPPLDYTLDALVGDLGRVAARADGHPVVLVGLSLGAATALRYALDPSARVDGLVCVSVPAPGDPSPTSWARSLADSILRDGLESAGERFVWGGGRFDAASARFIRQGFLEHDPIALACLARDALPAVPDVSSLAHRLAGLACPVLVVAGETDLPAQAQGRVLAREIPDARLEIVAGAGHVLNLQKPEQFNRLLLDFLSRF